MSSKLTTVLKQDTGGLILGVSFSHKYKEEGSRRLPLREASSCVQHQLCSVVITCALFTAFQSCASQSSGHDRISAAIIVTQLFFPGPVANERKEGDEHSLGSVLHLTTCSVAGLHTDGQTSLPFHLDEKQ